MLFKFAAPTMLIAVLLHTFVGTVAGTPQGPIIISCRGPNDHSALPAIFAATTQELGFARTRPSNVPLKCSMFRGLFLVSYRSTAIDRHLFKTTGCDKSSVDSANMCINGPSGVSASHPRLSALLNLPSPTSGPATSFSSSSTYTYSQPGFIPIHTPPPLSPEPFQTQLLIRSKNATTRGFRFVDVMQERRAVVRRYGDFPLHTLKNPKRNPFKSLKKNRSNLFVQNTAILFASVKVSHRAWVIQARRQEKGRFEDRRACVAPAIVCRRFVVRVTPNCYHRSQIRVILKFSTHKHSGGLIRLSRSSIIVFDIAAKS
ncbi:hypothetical protein LENED_012792 [Lentinula edodes]|uniref:Uncharacterized protein n=1 Tax=Lentinula edodes TaxID=5353 RepID=A0A1Q3ETI8_LENED|nr:hypothetical protein LENED_012792 [Lentinula edodes]